MTMFLNNIIRRIRLPWFFLLSGMLHALLLWKISFEVIHKPPQLSRFEVRVLDPRPENPTHITSESVSHPLSKSQSPISTTTVYTSKRDRQESSRRKP